jgi:hypothetical protein
VALDAAGAVYLQRGAETRRFAGMASLGTERGEPVMPGVALTAAWLADPSCCSL